MLRCNYQGKMWSNKEIVARWQKQYEMFQLAFEKLRDFGVTDDELTNLRFMCSRNDRVKPEKVLAKLSPQVLQTADYDVLCATVVVFSAAAYELTNIWGAILEANLGLIRKFIRSKRASLDDWSFKQLEELFVGELSLRSDSLLQSYNPAAGEFSTYFFGCALKQPFRAVLREFNSVGMTIHQENCLCKYRKHEKLLQEKGLPDDVASIAKHSGMSLNVAKNTEQLWRVAMASSLEQMTEHQYTGEKSIEDGFMERERRTDVLEALMECCQALRVENLTPDFLRSLLLGEITLREASRQLSLSEYKVKRLRERAKELLFEDERLRELVPDLQS